MSSIAAWNRPSSVFLLVVLAANLVLPVLYYWPGQAGAEETRDTLAGRPSGPEPEHPVTIEPVYPTVPAKRVAVRKPAPVCRAWGPFAELAEAETLAARLKLDSADFEVFQSEVEARPDYLVTVEAPGPRDVGDRLLEELESQGVEGYLLERDAQAGVLAVGVFSASQRAEAQRDRVVDLGYQATVKVLDRTHEVYHLMARVDRDQASALEAESPSLGGCGDIAPMQQFL